MIYQNGKSICISIQGIYAFIEWFHIQLGCLRTSMLPPPFKKCILFYLDDFERLFNFVLIKYILKIQVVLKSTENQSSKNLKPGNKWG